MLMMRVGMETNALIAQFHVGNDARGRTGALRLVQSVTLMATASALTEEAIQLASGGMSVLRDLALRADASGDLLVRVGHLCAGKHLASPVLKQASNQLAFHWDKAVIQSSVLEYGKNQKIVWLESNSDDTPVHRLAADVLAQALFPEAYQPFENEEQAHQAIRKAMSHISQAMNLIIEFFTASAHGYMQLCGAVRRTFDGAPVQDGGTSDGGEGGDRYLNRA